MDQEVRRYIDDLLAGRSVTCGEFSLAVGSTTATVVDRLAVSAVSVINTQAYSPNASNADIVRIVPTKGSFTVHHSSSGNIRTHWYSFVTGGTNVSS